MAQRDSKRDFFVMLGFLVCLVLLLSNGFVGRLAALEGEVDVYREMEPIGSVLDIVLREYVKPVEMEAVVEGALSGIMSSLDRNSAFVTAAEFEALQEETKGEFDGIGVSIKEDEEGRIMVFMPIMNSPASQAGLKPFDIIVAIAGTSTEGMDTAQAAQLIRGKRGTTVTLTILRPPADDAPEGTEAEQFDVEVKRDRIPLESVKEAQLLQDNVGYIRISSFSDTTARDMEDKLNQLLDQGMKTFVLDVRWNPGGLLSASKEVCELFLPKGSLVTYTRGRGSNDETPGKDDMRLSTSKKPVLPEDIPVIVLANSETASSAEIVTGALQFHQRAIVVGQKTFGKGSVQTVIPLQKPEKTALRLTTALYYTPADVTIDHQGILPDVEAPMTREEELALAKQMFAAYESDPENQYRQNHGSMTPGYEVTEETVEDLPLLRAVEMFGEGLGWQELLLKYHRDVRETQVAADINTLNAPRQTSLVYEDNSESVPDTEVPEP